MKATIEISQKPCLLCNKTAKTWLAKIRDAEFQGVLCEEHLRKIMERNGKPSTEPKQQ